MNFKINKWKIILSFLIILVIGCLGYSLTKCIGNPCTLEVKLLGGAIGIFYFGIPLSVVFYIIYSLFEKNKK